MFADHVIRGLAKVDPAFASSSSFVVSDYNITIRSSAQELKQKLEDDLKTSVDLVGKEGSFYEKESAYYASGQQYDVITSVFALHYMNRNYKYPDCVYARHLDPDRQAGVV